MTLHLPKRWWIGLPVLAGVAYLANENLTPQIEAGVRAQVAARLAQEPGAVDNPQISVNGRDVTISGVALSPEYKDRVFAMLGPESGARTLSDATQPVGLAKPFVFKLERRGAKVAVSGNMPVSDWRQKLRAELAAMGFEISDSAAFSKGEPGNFADIAGFALKRLAELDPADVTVTDAALSLAGEARSGADYDKLIASLDSAPVGREALKAQVSPPRVTPYVFSASLRDGVISLSGHLPDADLRKQLVAVAAQAGAGAAVSDATKLGAGAPADYAAALAFAVSELGKLSQGRVTIADGKLSIEGQGRDNIQPESVAADARARLPQGYELAKLEVTAGAVSPYVFNAERRGAEVTLSGYAPDEATRNRLLDAARKRFFDAAVIDRLAVAKGAPPAFPEAADRALDALARLAEGKLSISGADLTLSGAARFEAARRDVERGLAESLPQNFRSETLLTARTIGSDLDAAKCSAALADTLGKATLRFGADDMSIERESAPLVDALAATALRCQGAIEVGAYSGAGGIAELNMARSKRRAQALAEALVRAGADPFRVTGVGHGAAPSGAADRVEIVVK